MNTPEKPEHPEWSPAFYDESYYGKGGRNGFTSYDYHSETQKEQLALKWHFAEAVPHASALFVGCARGYEVAYWFARGKYAAGVDVSTWAIGNQIPEANGQCSLYDGKSLSNCPADHWPLVASFDVLSHLPDEILFPLVAEICRVARNGIVFRVIVKNWRNMDDAVDALDGSWVRYRRLEEWDRLFTQDGKFKLDWMKMHHQYEVTAIYKRA